MEPNAKYDLSLIFVHRKDSVITKDEDCDPLLEDYIMHIFVDVDIYDNGRYKPKNTIRKDAGDYMEEFTRSPEDGKPNKLKIGAYEKRKPTEFSCYHANYVKTFTAGGGGGGEVRDDIQVTKVHKRCTPPPNGYLIFYIPLHDEYTTSSSVLQGFQLRLKEARRQAEEKKVFESQMNRWLPEIIKTTDEVLDHFQKASVYTYPYD